ncbi:hypothetical protein [Pseudocolwellia agarivorans]|uniref:hypothetical protein n=1 Tax=Pseudocolwellia agarivorans TaxID=1911682 RepID=UPI000984B9CF|nr:hypothetical protein [Pseudocolwellia agarivorans]
MNCKLVNNTIEALNLADFTSGLDSQLTTHIKTCEACKKALQAQQLYLKKMSQIQAPEFSESEASAMLSHVVNSAQNNININKPAKNDSSFLQGFIAASVLALSVFGAWNIFNSSPEQTPLVAEVAPEYFTTEVVLVINAPEDMYDADLNLVLPQQIALEGYDNIHDLSWPVDLKAGTNTLSLPIRVNKNKAVEQPLSIMATLYHYADEREFEIKVDVEKMQAQQQNSAYLTPVANTTRV